MRRTTLAILMSLITVFAAHADGVLQVTDAYALVSRPDAPSGAIFMTIENPGPADDRLLSASASVAARAELHTHKMSDNGLMQMLEVPEGFAIPAGATHSLDRGGDHVMLMGLTRPLATGDRFTLDLTFEAAGKVVVIVTVGDAAPAGHGGHGAPAP
jgi:periplasmic copper chaperone A